MRSTRFTLTTLFFVVAISGMSQGLTIPLLSVILEERGVSTLHNGLNATALYIGILLVSPWMEIPLRRLGYRNTVYAGLILLTAATVLFPFFQSFALWFILRMVVGIGDVALNYASQMWVTDITPEARRGRNLSLYGLSFGIGFGIGPLGVYLLPFGLWVPFATICLFYAVAFAMLLRLPNTRPEPIAETASPSESPEASQAAELPSKPQHRYLTVIRLAWMALLPSLLYGLIETSLNGSFPIYALRLGLDTEWAPILASFTVGGLLLQLPLGAYSDRNGRKRVMMACAAVAAVAFAIVPLAGPSVWMLMLLFATAGAFVGSFYSLGLAYMADILPKSLVPVAGIVASMNFSAAAILAPALNGLLFDILSPAVMFILLSLSLGAFTVSGFFFRPSVRSATSASGLAK
ncbi:MFS transporter [Tumebacillus sp. DT12]|uniref:MFS transporter n=1 Tax=Tumebacillus lacus TaxID=2995335 RepID=A0ABT3WYT2_9BACL|nr:MFS transporter [Tumebacillus lacus]MCX7569820.1 MFS transporter [Tumebacillus lacus]